jgi:hypothetical protein
MGLEILHDSRYSRLALVVHNVRQYRAAKMRQLQKMVKEQMLQEEKAEEKSKLEKEELLKEGHVGLMDVGWYAFYQKIEVAVREEVTRPRTATLLLLKAFMKQGMAYRK